jgi:hypothetical protein
MSVTSRQQPAQIMVLFALAIVAMTAMVAVVLDGGTLYVQRRTVQNAADAAALGGARALQQATINPNGDVGTQLCTYLVANTFGVTPTATAYFVAADGTTNLGTILLPQGCSGTAPYTTIPTGASGVHVDATIGPYNTYMAGIVGIRQLSTHAVATAQVGVLSVPNPLLTPLAGCGPDMLFNGKSTTPSDNILVGNGSSTPYSINPARYGDDLVLQGSQMSQNTDPTICPSSGGSSWKGKIDTSGITGPLTLPTVIPTDNGNGTIDSAVTAVCASTGQGAPTGSAPPPDICLLLVPIAAPPNPSGNANIVLFGCFSMYAPGPGWQKWRGVLHPVTDCPYGVYTPGWTWGSGISQTRVLLTS